MRLLIIHILNRMLKVAQKDIGIFKMGDLLGFQYP